MDTGRNVGQLYAVVFRLIRFKTQYKHLSYVARYSLQPKVLRTPSLSDDDGCSSLEKNVCSKPVGMQTTQQNITGLLSSTHFVWRTISCVD